MRGENENDDTQWHRIMGSSPHARGKRSFASCSDFIVRLIPACAGKTAVDNGTRGNAWAHPRMRGENSAFSQHRRTQLGSSPHARGKPCNFVFSQLTAGLIPACAGKTLHGCKPFCPTQAHPRMRGENGRWSDAAIGALGSSPHARGKLSWIAWRPHRIGLIPACAGKTRPTPTESPSVTAHPRMRGENHGVAAD